MNHRAARLLALIVIAGLAGMLWFFRASFAPVSDETVVEPATIDKPARSGPRYPLTPADSTETVAGDLAPLPPLDDAGFRLTLVDNFGPDAGRILAKGALIDKFVVTVDNLTRSQVAEKIRPVGRLPNEFIAEESPDTGLFYLSPDNYGRFDLFVDMAVNTDPETIAATYRRFYPLFQQAYVQTGYPDGYFNDRVIEVIDHLLLTPEPDEPVLLVQPHVLYQFADEELEALSSGQKLLIRMGDDNAARIKQVLQNFRALILPPPDSTDPDF